MQWLFGYGSLIWRPDFSYVERHRAYLPNYRRRLWQRSPDHRGTETAPGRVATIIPCEGSVVLGIAYGLKLATWEAIVDALDYREKAGYARVVRDFYRDAACRERLASGFVYAPEADAECVAYGEPIEQTAAIIRRSVGPSGSNREYLRKLLDSLNDLDAEVPYVASLWQHVREN